MSLNDRYIRSEPADISWQMFAGSDLVHNRIKNMNEATESLLPPTQDFALAGAFYWIGTTLTCAIESRNSKLLGLIWG